MKTLLILSMFTRMFMVWDPSPEPEVTHYDATVHWYETRCHRCHILPKVETFKTTLPRAPLAGDSGFYVGKVRSCGGENCSDNSTEIHFTILDNGTIWEEYHD